MYQVIVWWRLLAEMAEQSKSGTAEKMAELKEQVDALVAESQAKSGNSAGQALRLDIVLTDSNGEELWLDPTCIHMHHQCNKTDRGPEVRRTLERLQAEHIHLQGAKIIEAATNKKLTHYGPLMAVARRQVTDGRRSKAPVFLPMVFTTHMEFGEGVVTVQEWLCERYRN